MAGEQNQGPITRKVAGTIPAYSLVKQDGNGEVVVCTATETDTAIGVTGNEKVVDNDYVAIWPLNTPGVLPMRSAGAISINSEVFQAADGEIAALPGSGGTTHRRVGFALEAAGAADEIIFVMPEFLGTTKDAPA